LDTALNIEQPMKRSSKKGDSPTEWSHGYPADWLAFSRNRDASSIWSALSEVVRKHPLVRNLSDAGTLSHADLTQELFLRLLTKNRFQHYLENGLTNEQIEAEIGRIELSNILTSDIRKRFPESFRLSRRISILLQDDADFVEKSAERRSRLSLRIFGLTDWSSEKPLRHYEEILERIRTVAVRSRDLRIAGRSADVQIVISNPDLKDLIKEVFITADSFMDVKTLRAAVLSRLSIIDASIVSMGGADPNGRLNEALIEDLRANPEAALLTTDGILALQRSVDTFLGKIKQAARGKIRQYNRMISILWHYYLSRQGRTQVEIADQLGISDSLVSDYRKRIETSLREMSLEELADARHFESVLKRKVEAMIANQND
jgi:uncharacterized protein YlzI (FlbEa/FlbD family)